MLALCSAVAIAAMSGCRDVSAKDREPTLLAPAVNLSNAQADSIRLTYLCGNRWRVRNPIADTATVTFDVYGTAERGSLLLPARAPGQPHSETVFVTANRGTTRLFHRKRLVQTKAPGKTVCAVPFVPLTPPDSLPIRLLTDSLRTTIHPGSGTRFTPELLLVGFKASATAADRGAALGAVGGVVVGGLVSDTENPSDGWYLVRIVGAKSFGALRTAIDVLYLRPGVEEVIYLEPPEDADLFRRPIDGPGFRAWFVERDSIFRNSAALQSIGALLAWACGVGSPAVGISVLGTPGFSESLSVGREKFLFADPTVRARSLPAARGAQGGTVDQHCSHPGVAGAADNPVRPLPGRRRSGRLPAPPRRQASFSPFERAAPHHPPSPAR
jgi:hypothetical protein